MPSWFNICLNVQEPLQGLSRQVEKSTTCERKMPSMNSCVSMTLSSDCIRVFCICDYMRHFCHSVILCASLTHLRICACIFYITDNSADVFLINMYNNLLISILLMLVHMNVLIWNTYVALWENREMDFVTNIHVMIFPGCIVRQNREMDLVTNIHVMISTSCIMRQIRDLDLITYIHVMISPGCILRQIREMDLPQVALSNTRPRASRSSMSSAMATPGPAPTPPRIVPMMRRSCPLRPRPLSFMAFVFAAWACTTATARTGEGLQPNNQNTNNRKHRKPQKPKTVFV